jgi:hypothetical protein
VKLPRTLSVILLAVALGVNLLAVAVWGRQAMQTGQFTPTLAISILLCLVIAPYLVMAWMRPKD